jgi:hypothetical protein
VRSEGGDFKTCRDRQKARCISRPWVLFKPSAGAELIGRGAASVAPRLANHPLIGAVLRGEVCPLFREAPKRSHLFTLRATKISANNQPSNWWPGERIGNEPGLGWLGASVGVPGDIMRVVICGGGLIGACTFYFLACRGIDVIAVERSEVAAAASGKAGGFLLPAALPPRDYR